jgi:hypothetical protein
VRDTEEIFARLEAITNQKIMEFASMAGIPRLRLSPAFSPDEIMIDIGVLHRYGPILAMALAGLEPRVTADGAIEGSGPL